VKKAEKEFDRRKEGLNYALKSAHLRKD